MDLRIRRVILVTTLLTQANAFYFWTFLFDLYKPMTTRAPVNPQCLTSPILGEHCRQDDQTCLEQNRYPGDDEGEMEPCEVKYGDIKTDTLQILPAFARLAKNTENKWPNGEVSYKFSPKFKEAGWDKYVDKAMQEMMEVTKSSGRSHVKFVQVTTDPQDGHIVFEKGDGCYSAVGRTGGSQKVSLANLDRISDKTYVTGTIMHELMHVLGFMHEHNRPDRDEYIKVNFDNIQPGATSSFAKLAKSQATDFSESYDFCSILHYNSFAYGKRDADGNFLRTIEIKREEDKQFLTCMGQRAQLSQGDIKRVQNFYPLN